MNTRHLTKKYKRKSRSRRRKTRRRVLKGGVRPSSVRPSDSVRPSVIPPSSRPSSSRPPSSRPSSVRPSDRPSGGISKPPSKPPSTHMLVNKFFKHLEYAEFDKALCELYNLYNSLPSDEINEILRSNSFKIRYENIFYKKDVITNYHGFTSCNIHAKHKYIIFLSYIFKKLIHADFIFCNRKRQDFVYTIDKTKIRMLTVLKRFLGYLDTACVNTTSYPITAERYDQISQGTAINVTHGERAIYDIISGLYELYDLRSIFPQYAAVQYILDNMTTTDEIRKIVVSYHVNTTVLSRFIRQTYTAF